jgi:hypothetical protein
METLAKGKHFTKSSLVVARCDLFGIAISLNYKNEIKYRSIFGGIFSLSMLGVMVFMAIQSARAYSSQSNMTIETHVTLLNIVSKC